MFGFGRKSPNNQKIESAASEIAMFCQWFNDTYGADMSDDGLSFVVSALLRKNGFKYSDRDVYKIINLAKSKDSTTVESMRKNTEYDSNVTRFLSRVKITEDWLSEQAVDQIFSSMTNRVENLNKEISVTLSIEEFTDIYMVIYELDRQGFFPDIFKKYRNLGPVLDVFDKINDTALSESQFPAKLRASGLIWAEFRLLLSDISEKSSDDKNIIETTRNVQEKIFHQLTQ